MDDTESTSPTPRLDRVHADDWELVGFKLCATQQARTLNLGDGFGKLLIAKLQIK